MKQFLFTLAILAGLVISGRADVLDNGKRVSLEFESTPLVAVLNMLAQQNNLNVVVAGNVTGDVSVRLQDVDIRTALDAVLTANGFTYFVNDDVIVVKPIDETEAGDLVSRLVTLKYLNPITAQKALAPRMSEKGKVVILDKSSESLKSNGKYSPNRVLITDYPAVVDELVAVVSGMDVRERSILIEAKIIETKIDNQKRLGLNWPSAIRTRLSGADDGTSTSTSGTSTTTTTTVNTNSLRNAGVHDLEAGRWTWGKLSVVELEAVLDFLEQDGNSRLVSDPHITTVENHEAEFKFETVIPIQTINRFTEGAATSDIVSFEDEEVGISLRVTPRINEGGTITLDVHPKVEDIIGFNGPPDNQKPITASRSIQTRITVQDGETVALGGLIKEDEIETVNKVPLLGSIPLLGKLLFTHKSKEKTKTDLMILITPHILD